MILKLRLILALFWVLLGVWILVYDPPELRLTLGGEWSITGWIALLLAAYNLVRWWNYRSALEARRLALEAEQARERRHRLEKGPPPEPNPDFQFEDKPQQGPSPPSA